MKRIIQYTFSLIILFSSNIQSQDYDKDAFLKDYSGDLIITTQVRGERNKV